MKRYQYITLESVRADGEGIRDAANRIKLYIAPALPHGYNALRFCIKSEASITGLARANPFNKMTR